ncbi:MAG: polysulfide reductase NrfD [Actinomycetaceae bacterium]|nr:polysulfide reductase NrfD [Arcanobacterium sp.]MDD7687042.1 polysulfide reductase NrfD [Actinomycetaceae bacterium]MDY5273301.1 NrfD/PsrC family molybdoenzyme membrane anchor subunit [Arcanobacterium sp.]
MARTQQTRQTRRLFSTAIATIKQHGIAVGVLAALVLITAYPVIQRLIGGLGPSTDVTNQVPWGLWVIFYVYFVGMSAGAALISTLSYVFNLQVFDSIRRAALVVALLGLAFGGLFIGFDIGRWDRLFSTFIFFHWTSALSWEIRFFFLYIIVLAVMLIVDIRLTLGKSAHPDRARSVLKGFGIALIPIALLGVLGSEAMIFSTNSTRPMWYGPMLPLVFIISSVMAGAAILIVIAYVHERSQQRQLKRQDGQDRQGRRDIAVAAPFTTAPLIAALGKILLTFTFIDMLVSTFEYCVPLLAGESAELTVIRWTTTGPWAWVFWGLYIAVGLVGTAAILLSRFGRSSHGILTAAICALIGVLAIRFTIVIPPQIPRLLSGFPAGEFAPTLSEWLVAVCFISLGVLLYVLATAFLPIHPHDCTASAGSQLSAHSDSVSMSPDSTSENLDSTGDNALAAAATFSSDQGDK